MYSREWPSYKHTLMLISEFVCDRPLAIQRAVKVQEMRDRDMKEENRGRESANIKGKRMYKCLLQQLQGTVGLPH